MSQRKTDMAMLPDDIVYAIVARLTAEARLPVDDWAGLLPLLAVCSQWRRVGVPVVYSQGFIDDQALGPLGVHQRCHSNLELCASTQNTRHLRTLRIETGPARATHAYLGQVEADHRSVDWSQIRSLTLRQLGHRPQHMLDFYATIAHKLSEFITSRMPQIKTLDTIIVDGHPNRDSIGSLLARHYAHRLTTVRSLAPLALGGACFAELTRLQLCLSGESQLPLVLRGTLRHLTLSNVPHDFGWAPLAGGTGNGLVVFGALEYMCLYYKSSNGSRDALDEARPHGSVAPETLHFPVLEVLELIWCTSGCRVLQSAVLPKALKRVYLHCSPAALPLLASRDMVQIGRLTVDVATGATADPHLFLESSNRLFGARSPAECTRMIITGLPEIVDIGSVAWTRLSSLTIRFHFGVRRLLALLCGLPRLQVLHALALDARQFDLPAAQSALGSLPRETLRCASIYPANLALGHEKYLAFLGFFAAAHAGLQRLGVSRSAVSYVKALGTVSGKRHPHLACLRVECPGQIPPFRKEWQL